MITVGELISVLSSVDPEALIFFAQRYVDPRESKHGADLVRARQNFPSTVVFGGISRVLAEKSRPHHSTKSGLPNIAVLTYNPEDKNLRALTLLSALREVSPVLRLYYMHTHVETMGAKCLGDIASTWSEYEQRPVVSLKEPPRLKPLARIQLEDTPQNQPFDGKMQACVTLYGAATLFTVR